MARQTNILKRMRQLSKKGFRIEYLAGIYAHKGPKGLSQIEKEVKRVEKAIH